MMAIYLTILLGIFTLIHSTFGGLLHGLTYSAASTPVDYNYGRIATYSSPSIIANPSIAATYSTRYTAYTAVPLTASVAANGLVPRQSFGGYVRAFAAPSFSRNSVLSNPLIRQGVSAYAAVPIAGYRASFGGPSIRSCGASALRRIPAAYSVQGQYPLADGGFEDYADPLINDQRAFGGFENENPISVW